MSCMIDPCQPQRPFLQQLQHLRQNTSIQELHKHQQDLYEQIRDKFRYIYRAEGQPIYDKYQQVKQDINHILKEKGWALKAQLKGDYNAAAPMQDMLAQLAVNDAILSPVQPSSISVKYVFKKRACIVQAFFNLSLSVKCDENLDWQIFIVNDLVSLCTHQEWRSQKPCQS